jgi:hypothetical protein
MLSSADALRDLCGENELPIQLADISELRRITSVRLSPLEYMDASLVPHETGFTVLLSQDAPRVRQRASLAHEIGHTFFYDLRSPRPERLIRGWSPSDKCRAKEEKFCWAFAAELLMPAKLVAPLAASSGDSHLALAHDIASRSEVSMELALQRLLHVFPPFAECLAITAVPGRTATRRVARYWGRRGQQSLPPDVRRCSDKIKEALSSTATPLDLGLRSLLESAGNIARDNGAVIEWLEWDSVWGESIVVFFDLRAVGDQPRRRSARPRGRK